MTGLSADATAPTIALTASSLGSVTSGANSVAAGMSLLPFISVWSDWRVAVYVTAAAPALALFLVAPLFGAFTVTAPGQSNSGISRNGVPEWEIDPQFAKDAFTFVRSGIMMPGKFQQGQQYVQNRIKWMNENYGAEASLMVQLGGPAGSIAMVGELESVAQLEEIRRKIVGGALPKELATGQEGLFIPGETMDRIWLKISGHCGSYLVSSESNR